MSEKSSNISSNIFYISIGAECLGIARACNNQNFFLNSIYPLVRCMILQGAKNCRIANILLKIFNKNQGPFNYVAKTGKELLAIS